MLEQKKFHKLCKYGIRMKKSLISNNSNDYAKYCLHLKYHIREQIGNGTNQELNNLFEKLTKFIVNNKETYNIEYIKDKFNEEKTQLETKLNEYSKQINELMNNQIKLESNIKTFEKTINENNEQNTKDKLELDEIKKQLDEAKIKIKQLEEQKQKQLQDIDINKLKELTQTNYSEFIKIFKNIFTEIYGNDIAEKIIKAIENGDIEIQKQIQKSNNSYIERMK